MNHLLRLLGVPRPLLWLSWFLNCMASMTFLSAIITVIVTLGQIITYTDPRWAAKREMVSLRFCCHYLSLDVECR